MLQRQLSDPRLREVMTGLRCEVLALEDAIPWTAVRRHWRNRRSGWRRQVKAGEQVPDMALRLKVRSCREGTAGYGAGD